MGVMKFYEKLDKYSRIKGFKQSDLVRLLGDVSKDTVSRWFNDKGEPDMRTGLRLARVLDVPYEFLADDSLDEAPSVSRRKQFISGIIAEIGEADALVRLLAKRDVAEMPSEEVLKDVLQRVKEKRWPLYEDGDLPAEDVDSYTNLEFTREDLYKEYEKNAKELLRVMALLKQVAASGPGPAREAALLSAGGEVVVPAPEAKGKRRKA
jgi:transcriptional regulator with XRE-family HTH domain